MKYGNDMSADLIIQGVVTDYDRHENIDCIEDIEPKSAGTDNCFPMHVNLKLKEKPPSFIDIKSAEPPSPGLRDLAKSQRFKA